MTIKIAAIFVKYLIETYPLPVGERVGFVINLAASLLSRLAALYFTSKSVTYKT